MNKKSRVILCFLVNLMLFLNAGAFSKDVYANEEETYKVILHVSSANQDDVIEPLEFEYEWKEGITLNDGITIHPSLPLDC